MSGGAGMVGRRGFVAVLSALPTFGLGSKRSHGFGMQGPRLGGDVPMGASQAASNAQPLLAGLTDAAKLLFRRSIEAARRTHAKREIMGGLDPDLVALRSASPAWKVGQQWRRAKAEHDAQAALERGLFGKVKFSARWLLDDD